MDRDRKIVILGDSNSGKSALIERFLTNTFIEDHIVTPSTNIRSKAFKTGSISLNLQLVIYKQWDIGSERGVVDLLIRGSDAVFILFDMSKESSLSETDYWIKAAKDNAKPTSKSFLIGNKSDLQAKISSEEIIDYATEKNLIFLDISVKGNLKIEFLFELLAKELDFQRDQVQISNL